MKIGTSTLVGLAALQPFVSADIEWPLYSQQCRDDAGPPYGDDVPGVKYHAGSAAYPVLVNGECAQPLQSACNSRPDFKTAYLEGPISCGDNGWYCRIFNDEANGWANINLNTDVNFGECNKEESFEGPWYDQDGHCHGSSYDSTYYWWIRDHWFRQYNGRVRCCCGWLEGSSQPVTEGRIANRCDYRRLVTQSENLSNCRDANESHGLGFEGGCDQQFSYQIGASIPEDDSVCWEIERFGYMKKPTHSPVKSTPTPTSGPTTAPTAKPTNLPTSNPTPIPTEPPTPNPTNAPVPPQGPGQNFRAVVCGRGYNCPEGDFDVVDMNTLHEVRCCRDCVNDGSCERFWKQQCDFDPEVYAASKFDGICYEEDFCTASDICADAGGRLCTPEEVLESCAERTGCNFDRELVWACMWEGGGCEWDEECCSGRCGQDGLCLLAETGMCN